MRLGTFIVLVASSSCAWGQAVRDEDHTDGHLRRTADTQASEDGRADWPKVNDNEAGTQVHITFGYRDADIILLSWPPVSRNRLLSDARRLSAAIDMPDADYIFVPVVTYSNIDIELNKYLKKRDKTHSVNLNLAALGQALAADSTLPKPIVIRVDPAEADSTTLNTYSTAKAIDRPAFFAPSQIGIGSTITFTAAADWKSYLAVGIMGVFFALVLGFLAYMPWVSEKGLRKMLAKQGVGPKSPEEVQAKYDRKKPGYLGLLILIAAMILLMGMGVGMRHAATAMDRLMPEPGPWTVVAIILGTFSIPALSRLIYTLDRNRRMKSDASLVEVVEKVQSLGTDRMSKRFVYFPLVMLPLFLLTILSVQFHLLRTLPSYERLLILLVVAGLPWILFVWFLFRGRGKDVPALQPGDLAYDAAHEFATKAGVKVRRVEVLPSEKCNAYARIGGTVGVTKGLLEKCDPDEVRAVVAHEIGHHRAKHLHKLLPLSLGLWFVLALGYNLGIARLRPHLSEDGRLMLQTPVILFLVLFIVLQLALGPLRRRYEREADRFAVEATGDAELVARALTKIHTLNESPFRLKPVDEAIMSHPSLEHRLEAIKDIQLPPKQD